jgi:hypothetical protein
MEFLKMISNDYLFTTKYSNVNDFSPISNSIFIFARSSEDRSSHIVNSLSIKYHNVEFIEIKMLEDEKDVIIDVKTKKKYYLRNSKSIQSLFKDHNATVVYIDVTGLNNRISAAILKNAVHLSEKQTLEIKVIYVEPYVYQIQKFKAEGVFNDLSEEIDGIDPLPGFATVIPNNDDIKFIVLLGFEGGRFSYLKECVQPSDDNITPIVGVPGFRIEYPFVALWGNRLPLEDTRSWSNIRYVSANSIPDTYFLLKKILDQPPKNYKMVLAPIGTKPHVIAAVLFAIQFPKQVEIVYDNPKRKINRTDGTGLIVVCDITSLLSKK